MLDAAQPYVTPTAGELELIERMVEELPLSCIMYYFVADEDFKTEVVETLKCALLKRRQKRLKPKHRNTTVSEATLLAYRMWSEQKAAGVKRVRWEPIVKQVRKIYFYPKHKTDAEVRDSIRRRIVNHVKGNKRRLAKD